jgi:hypothetical protein
MWSPTGIARGFLLPGQNANFKLKLPAYLPTTGRQGGGSSRLAREKFKRRVPFLDILHFALFILK